MGITTETSHRTQPIRATSQNETSLVTQVVAVAATLQSIFPISMRGLLVLLLLVYLILNPIWNQSDIVASVLVVGLLFLLAILNLTCAVTGFFLKRKLAPYLLSPSADGSHVYSKTQVRIPLRLGPVTIPPFFVLTCSLRFGEGVANTSYHIITGSITPAEPVVHEVIFPHRGLWRLTGVWCELEDRFGFTNITWTDIHQKDQVIAVHPTPIQSAKLPIISSTFRPGDDVSHSTHRMGEQFDIKPYHPSDGIKRILWKVFAKRGELVARHPEQAVTPEGHVIGVILTTRASDDLAAWVLHYFQDLRELNISYEVGCLGMGEQPLARSPEELADLLISSAFHSPLEITQNDREQVVYNLAKTAGSTDIQSTTIALFVSDMQLRSEQMIRSIITICRDLTGLHYTPVLCLQRSELPGSAATTSRLARLLFKQNTPSDLNTAITPMRNALLRACSAADLQVFQEPISHHRSTQQ